MAPKNQNETKKYDKSYLILGAGGCGASIGAFLSRAGKNVSFIARGRHLAAMKRQGLRMETTRLGSFTVAPVAAFDEKEYMDGIAGSLFERPDVIFVCVKYYSLEALVPFLKAVAGASTVIIPILNIYGTGQVLRERLPGYVVTDGCMYIAAEIKEPGCIVQKGDIFRVVYGMPHGMGSEDVMQSLLEIREDLQESGIEGIVSEDIAKDALIKFSLVSPMAACGAYFDIRIGRMQRPGKERELFTELVSEIASLGKALGVYLPENIVERNLTLIDALLPDACASMQRDLWAGREREIDGIVFEVQRMAHKAGIKLAAYDKVAAKLSRPME